jgi:hypothetical protein
VAAAVSAEGFVTAQKDIVGDDPASLMGVNSVLGELCDACDKHVTALPTEAPIDFAKLRSDVENVVGGFPSCHNSSAAISAFADTFISKIDKRLEKRAPPPVPVDAAPDRKHKRVEMPAAPSYNGAVLGDQPPLNLPLPRSQQYMSPPTGGLLGNAPPPNHMGSMYAMQQHHAYHHQHHLPPPMVNVFNAPQAPVEEAPDLGTRYLTLRPLPPAIQSVNALRTALSDLTKVHNRGQRISYLNVEVFEESQLPQPEGVVTPDTPPPSGYFAVVSFTNVNGASKVAHHINTMSDRDGTPVRGAGSTQDEVVLIWGSHREELENLEVELGTELDAYPSTRPAGLYATLDALNAQKGELMSQIDEMKKTATTVEEKEALKDVYRKLLAANKEAAEVSQRLKGFGLNPAASAEERTIPPELFSTSPSEITSMGQLIFISGAADPMPDNMVLLLLQKLMITPVHIWRDTASTTISVEVESAGVAFSILRRLDFIDCNICGLTISKERPRPEKPATE